MVMVKDLFQHILSNFYEFLQTQNRYWKYNDFVKRGLLEVGRHTYGIPEVYVYKGSERKIIIGSFCSIGEGVVMVTGGIHPSKWISTFPFRIKWNLQGAYQDGMPSSEGNITIGSDVWIGSEAMLLSGVTIGHGAIIAARSVVTNDIPPYSIVGGIPAKVLRHRFNDDVVKQLLEIKWWEKDDPWIAQFVDLLNSERIDELFQVFHQHQAEKK